MSNGTIFRGGEAYGIITSRPNGEVLVSTFDHFESTQGSEFFEPSGGVAPADLRSSYTISSTGDPDFASAEAPDGVWRKSKIVDTAYVSTFEREFVNQHDVFLQLDQPLALGQTYTIEIADPAFAPLAVTYDPVDARSEAVHVSQVGFEPDDPIKAAFLSTWLGGNAESPGASNQVEYQIGDEFQLLNATNNQVVYTGNIELDKAASSLSNFSLNFNQTDVYRLDFSDFSTPGTYKVVVDGVGASFPFAIAGNAWTEAFETAMTGFYHQRSGTALEAPHTDWLRPRSLHPDDGFVVHQSTASLMDTSMGLDLLDQNSFSALVAGKTNEEIAEAWGGWHDAGDWDRRIQQLDSARDLLELAETRPEFAANAQLAIPERGNNLPDVVDEALWSVDLYQRLQKDDGGVPGGIEAAGHPLRGESSWTESQDLFVYAPDAWSSYIYAGVAARAALLVEPFDAARADGYRESSIRAMNWAEANLPQYAADQPEVINERNLAAAELYRLTGEQQWHDIFVDSSAYREAGSLAWNEHQYASTFVYARTDRPQDATILERGMDDLVGRANFLTSTGDRGAFDQIMNPYSPYGYGYTSAIPADAADILVRAHALTGDARFFEAALADTQFGLGANPDNLVFTTGLGERSPQEPLIVDMAAMNGEAPDGITLFGGWNVADRGWHNSFDVIAGEAFPNFPNAWPVHETYVGYTKAVPIVEFAMHTTMGPTAYVWGYLAGTDADSGPAPIPDLDAAPPADTPLAAVDDSVETEQGVTVSVDVLANDLEPDAGDLPLVLSLTPEQEV
ncbi:MAG: glycoside hydrolase family 9 protein [Geminicoccaceae bacterium]|nr:glycoside hydrolase family 9 protein [Geminicoccaceae bacterium]